ncbi:MAG: hypothetical protein WD468_04425, partial [Pirellulales bacterium]
PANDFLAFMQAYYTRCRARVPNIRAVAAKWTFEDLIPGLSDFDTRFILAEPMNASDWQAMSLAVGEVHTDMARQFTHWHRNLEHLPGINLTLGELLDERMFYPEFKQWTFYEGDGDAIRKVENHLAGIAWSRGDEHYHLKKVATFFGPYQRGIDPPINLGLWENKYALHSRLMHYFTPPVHAMVCLFEHRTIPGKLEALRMARQRFPMPEVIDELFEIVEAHYERPTLYVDPALRALEQRLEQYLTQAWASLGGALTLVEPAANETPQSLRAKVNQVPMDPIQAFREGARFSRLMEGRLRFYAASLPDFDAAWLIRNELGRIVPNFYDKPLRACGGLLLSDPDLGPDQVLQRLRGDVLSDDDVAGMKRFARLAAVPFEAGQERERARQIAAAYAPVLRCLEKISTHLLQPSSSPVAGHMDAGIPRSK